MDLVFPMDFTEDEGLSTFRLPVEDAGPPLEEATTDIEALEMISSSSSSDSVHS